MTIPAISSVAAAAIPAERPDAPSSPAGIEEASRQFEAIMLRQFLGESMKPLLNAPGMQVYGYLVTDSLADSLSKGGGLGLSSILQAQLGKEQP